MTTAITGVHASDEVEIRSKYPSIAATGLGCVLGSVFDSIPVRIWGVKLSNLLFVLPLAPLGVLLYALMKLTGERYVLTNRSVQRWAAVGVQQYQSVSLSDIAEIEYVQQAGQKFFHAGDLILVNAKGDPLMTIKGIQNADVFQQTVLRARDARNQTEESLETIAARA